MGEKMSEVHIPKTYHFQGLEVSKPSCYKSLNSSSTNPNLCISDEYDQPNEPNKKDSYKSLLDQLKNLFIVN